MTDTHVSEPIAALTAAVERLEAQVAKIAGFAADDDEWEWVECDGEGDWANLKPREGAEPLRAEVLVSLTIGQALQVPYESGRPLRDLFPALTRCVRDWNVTALNLVTGEYEKVPPPMVGGEDSLRAVRKSVIEWLAFTVKFSHLRGNFPKASLPPDDGPGNPSASDSAFPQPAPSRRSRTTSTSR